MTVTRFLEPGETINRKHRPSASAHMMQGGRWARLINDARTIETISSLCQCTSSSGSSISAMPSISSEMIAADPTIHTPKPAGRKKKLTASPTMNRKNQPNKRAMGMHLQSGTGKDSHASSGRSSTASNRHRYFFVACVSSESSAAEPTIHTPSPVEKSALQIRRPMMQSRTQTMRRFMRNPIWNTEQTRFPKAMSGRHNFVSVKGFCAEPLRVADTISATHANH